MVENPGREWLNQSEIANIPGLHLSLTAAGRLSAQR